MSNKIDISMYHDIIVKMFSFECKTDREILNKIGTDLCSVSKITTYRKEHNINRIYKNYDWLKEKYDLGLTAYEISQFCGCSSGEISKWLKRLGISNDDKKSVYQINKVYFSNYSNRSAYWAGFINADGHIENYVPKGRKLPNYKLKFTIGEKDKEHIKKLCIDLGYPETSLKNGFSSIRGKINKNVKFSTSIKQICIDLIKNFNIIDGGNKSCYERFPNIPKEYMRDYIRGYFDGDGCVSVYSKIPQITIVGGYNFLYDLKCFLSKEAGENIGHIYKERKNDLGNKNLLYRYQISKTSSVLFFYNYIYYDNCICLERKRDKFESSELIRYSPNFNEN